MKRVFCENHAFSFNKGYNVRKPFGSAPVNLLITRFHTGTKLHFFESNIIISPKITYILFLIDFMDCLNNSFKLHFCFKIQIRHYNPPLTLKSYLPPLHLLGRQFLYLHPMWFYCFVFSQVLLNFTGVFD